eukprot:858642-Prorocentrum_lima.AAC.1
MIAAVYRLAHSTSTHTQVDREVELAARIHVSTEALRAQLQERDTNLANGFPVSTRLPGIRQ